jgi:hypothetical protein
MRFDERDPYAYDTVCKIIKLLNELHDEGWRVQGDLGFNLSNGFENLVLYQDQFCWEYREDA